MNAESFDPAAESGDPSVRVRRIKALIDAAPGAIGEDDLAFLKDADPPAYRAMQRRAATPSRVPRAKDRYLTTADAVAIADAIALAVDVTTAPLLARIEVLEQQPKGLTFAGSWQRAQTYDRHVGVVHQGSLWVCVGAKSCGEAPGTANAWQLCAKAGKDGKDAV